MLQWNELTDYQKSQVKAMYPSGKPFDHFQYDYDDNGNYHGRTPIENDGPVKENEDRTASEVVQDIKEAVTGTKKKRTKK